MKDLKDMDLVEFCEYMWDIRFTWFQKRLLRKVAQGSNTLAAIAAWYGPTEKKNDSERCY